MRVLLKATACLCVAGAFAEDRLPAKRLPIPAVTAMQDSLALVRELFKMDFDRAKSPEEQTALAEKLMKTAAETKDNPNGQFALWQLAVETATKNGDIKTAYAALDEVVKVYEVDELTAKSKAFVTLAPKITAKNIRTVFLQGSNLIGRAVGADRFEVANAVSEPLGIAVQKFGDAAMKKDAILQLDEIKRIQLAYAEVLVALKKLNANAADPIANLTVGKYQIDKGNWEAALSYLALSEDPQYKLVAVMELAHPTEVAKRIAVADEWWKLGDSVKMPLKGQLQLHAAELYAASLSDATGLSKKKIEIRIADAAKIPKSRWDLKPTPEVKVPVTKETKERHTITNSIGLNLNLIPAGQFVMGSPEKEIGRHPGETQHRVKITKPYYLGVYEVTRGQFARFVAAENYKTDAEKDGRGGYGKDVQGNVTQKPEYSWRNPGQFSNQEGDNCPVANVSWNDANAFCQWLAKKEGKTYRLPTEAEWEYACRAGTTTPFHFGNSLNGDNANCDGTLPYGTTTKGNLLKRTKPVGSYKPNAFGLYDMHGNTWEWCADFYDKDYYTAAPLEDPQGPNSGSAHVLRGGGLNSPAVDCRSAQRNGNRGPADRDRYIGFRVVMNVDN